MQSDLCISDQARQTVGAFSASPCVCHPVEPQEWVDAVSGQRKYASMSHMNLPFASLCPRASAQLPVTYCPRYPAARLLSQQTLIQILWFALRTVLLENTSVATIFPNQEMGLTVVCSSSASESLSSSEGTQGRQ